MTRRRYDPEEFEAGELVGVYGPDPSRRAWVLVEVGPPDSDRLIHLARERGAGAGELARDFIHDALDSRDNRRPLPIRNDKANSRAGANSTFAGPNSKPTETLSRTLHVIPHGSKWAVEREGSQRATRVVDSRQEAL